MTLIPATPQPVAMDEPVQQTVEELLRPMSAESDRFAPFDPNFPTISPALEFTLVAVFAMFSPLLVDLPLGGLLRHSPDGVVFLGCTLGAAAGVRFGLLAIWLAWGQLRVVWRLPIVLPSVALGAMAWAGGRHNDWRDVMPTALFIFLATAIAAATPRLFGVYRVNLFDLPLEKADGNVHEGQFRLIDMFAWTATAAVLAGMMRWIGLPHDWEWVAIIIFVPICSLMALSALWATLTKREIIAHRILAAFGVAFGIAMILSAFAGGMFEVIFYFCYTLMLAMGLLIGALCVARSMGVRLVSRSLPLILPPPTSNSPAAAPATTQNETSPEVAAPGLE